MTEISWSRLLARAFDNKLESEALLNTAVRLLVLSKGFSMEVAGCFSASFTGSNEAVIHFCDEYKFSDFGVYEAVGMTKDEIIDRLLPYLSDSSKNKLW